MCSDSKYLMSLISNLVNSLFLLKYMLKIPEIVICDGIFNKYSIQ